MENVTYPIDLKRLASVDIGSSGVTVAGVNKQNDGHADFAQVAGIFVCDSGGRASQRRLILLLNDGRTVGFLVSLNPMSPGTQGAPVVDHDAAMKGFHTAAAATLRQLALARPDLQTVELAPPPAERMHMKIVGGCGLLVVIVLLLVFAPPDLANMRTLLPYLGWLALGAIFGWSNWVAKPKHVSISKLGDLIAGQPSKLSD